jgi:hypothetical protein
LLHLCAYSFAVPPPDADEELERRLAAFKGTKNWKEVRAEREGGEKRDSSDAVAAPVRE